MNNLLYLVHRLPYPPNKGDKITSYNLLRYFSSRYRVFLGTFIDDPGDRQYIPEVQKYCEDACFIDLNPSVAKIASLRGLLRGEALTLPFYRSSALKRWADQTVADHPPDAVLIFSGAMAQYVPTGLEDTAQTVFDMEDIDSDKWRSYAESKRWPLNWLYARESDRLLAFEREMAARFAVTVFVSKEEAELFETLAPESKGKISYRTQGVDSDYFDPAIELENPYSGNVRPLVFCGAMDYWPNVDAVKWYADEVFPAVRRHTPNALFCIVGMNPTEEVRRLGERPGIMVTGGVPDVRPYVAHAAAAVLPLRIARGIQNKVLEAMALEKPVIGTPAAMTGIIPCPEFQPMVAETADGLIDATNQFLDSGTDKDPGGRACVQQHYNWEANLRRIDELLSGRQPVEPVTNS